MHISLPTAEHIDQVLCLLPLLFRALLSARWSNAIDGYEAHLQYTFLLTDTKKGIKRDDLEPIERLIHRSKVAMAAIIPSSRLCRPKFASMDYWVPLIKFLGHPMGFNSTPFEAYHQVWKQAGAATNGHNVEHQVLSYAANKLAFDLGVTLYPCATRSAQLVIGEAQLVRQNQPTPGFAPCGDKVPSPHRPNAYWYYAKARYNGFVVKMGQYLRITGIAGFPEPQVCLFHGIDQERERQVYRLHLTRFSLRSHWPNSRIFICSEETTLFHPIADLHVLELLGVHFVRGYLLLNAYVRRPYYYEQ